MNNNGFLFPWEPPIREELAWQTIANSIGTV